MTQPDTIVRDPGNPQVWNRYSYALNNPIRYTDPTGHRPIIDEDEYGNPIVETGWHPSKRNNSGGKSRDRDLVTSEQPSYIGPSCIFCPDAYYSALNVTAGWFHLYASWSFDLVITDRQIAVFSVFSLGPGFNPNEIPGSIRQERMDASLVSPQIGATLFGGALWGNVLKEVGVETYQGPSEIFGGGLQPESLLGGLGVAGEYFRSVDRWSGEPNGDITGVGGGISAGSPFAAVQHIFADAKYQSELSYFATTVGCLLNILH